MRTCIKCGLKSDDMDLFVSHKNYYMGKLNKCKRCHATEQAMRRGERDYRYKKRAGRGQLRSEAIELGIGKGFIWRYGPELCLEVFRRDEFMCQECGSTESLSIHHKDGAGRHYQENGGEPNNNPENLILLCFSCHGRIHGKRCKH